jgi:hypothetical protein
VTNEQLAALLFQLMRQINIAAMPLIDYACSPNRSVPTPDELRKIGIELHGLAMALSSNISVLVGKNL